MGHIWNCDSCGHHWIEVTEPAHTTPPCPMCASPKVWEEM